jgi:hypothetical protein
MNGIGTGLASIRHAEPVQHGEHGCELALAVLRKL